MTRKMKFRRVLLAHPSADLYGSDRVVLESVQGLISAGARVVVTIPSPGPLVTELERRGAEVIICDTVILRRALMAASALVKLVPASVAAAARAMALILRVRPEVVYVNTLTLPLWTILPRLMGCKVVVHVHEAEQSAQAIVKRALATPLLFATEILANSRFTEKVLLSANPLLAGKITVIDNAVPSPAHTTSPRPVLRDSVRLLYVGRLSHRKGVDVAVAALAHLTARGFEARLDIVGAVYAGNESYERQLVELIESADIEDRVHFHGFHRDIWPFLSEADIALVPARQDESFGNTAVEALLSGRPVIVSDTSGLREAAGGYAAVHFVPPADPEAIADATEKISAGWADWKERSARDSVAAALRHSPELYQERISTRLLR